MSYLLKSECCSRMEHSVSKVPCSRKWGCPPILPCFSCPPLPREKVQMSTCTPLPLLPVSSLLPPSQNCDTLPLPHCSRWCSMVWAIPRPLKAVFRRTSPLHAHLWGAFAPVCHGPDCHLWPLEFQ